jgi:hypothetical protein
MAGDRGTHDWMVDTLARVDERTECLPNLCATVSKHETRIQMLERFGKIACGVLVFTSTTLGGIWLYRLFTSTAQIAK